MKQADKDFLKEVGIGIISIGGLILCFYLWDTFFDNGCDCIEYVEENIFGRIDRHCFEWKCDN